MIVHGSAYVTAGFAVLRAVPAPAAGVSAPVPFWHIDPLGAVLTLAALGLLGAVLVTLRLNADLRRTRTSLEEQLIESSRQQVQLQAAIEEHRKLEEQLVQSHKMEALGRLAGGIAHDFNNLLMVIRGYCENLLERVPENSNWREDIEEIRDAGLRASTLTGQLLAFSRRQMLESRMVDLGEIVRDNLKLLEKLAGPLAKLETDLAPNVPAVRADPARVEQALWNLVGNAHDAISGAGTITVGLAETTLSDPPGRFAVLSVIDSGCGMDLLTQSRIFEPFFTTKEKGKGTGLGLATVYGIVHQCGGFIRLESAPGCGSRFDLFLPALGENERRDPPLAASAAASAG
jgi:two-component system, cell cycle sensor histidine kinase and response regulator CckA